MTWLNIFNLVTSILLTISYAYQFYYVAYALLVKPRKYKSTNQTNKYAVMLSARNEELVIGHLIDTLHEQTYPQENIDIYVVADNCTDNTYKIVKEKGCIAFERFNQKQIGKGYALDFLFGKLFELKGQDYYNAYFVFDADNLLDKNYIAEMDKCFSAGNRIITSYRNSKNYGDNWISAGYALWFIREARYLNNPRNLLGTSCAVSGTGFMVDSSIIKKQGGWKHFLLTEDIEFSIDSVCKGEKIAYCHDAMLYDEQPVKFSVSWRQRLRWAKGFLQVLRNYGLKLVSGVVHFKGFSFFDMLMTIAPAMLITISNFIVNAVALIYTLIARPHLALPVLAGIGYTALSAYLLLIVVGLITIITEWDKIYCSTFKKFLYLFTFPIFMLTYIPIAIQALFVKVEWKPIEHVRDKTMKDIKK